MSKQRFNHEEAIKLYNEGMSAREVSRRLVESI